MDWDKCNFKRINQRRTELKRWVTRDEDGPAKSPGKGSKHTRSKRKKGKK